MREITTLKWENGNLLLLDQTLLPNTVTYVTCKNLEDIYQAIQTMIVRGAPAIGVTAGYGMVLVANAYEEALEVPFLDYLKEKGEYLKSSRPTAVNLMWAVDRIVNKAGELEGQPLEVIKKEIEAEAVAIHEEDKQTNRNIGINLLSLLKDGDTVLTHCNAGSLATAEYGTALSVFYMAQEKGMKIRAFADETRPRLQGANLTAFELTEHGVDVTLICDNMAAVVMSQGKIDAVIVGCDRVAANGDTANKIGTFSVSVLAKQFGIPVYIAAPTTTIDMDCPTGKEIPIEERSSDEVLRINGSYIAPKEVKTYNLAFDVTPAEYITAIVTEKGIVNAPFCDNLKILMKK
ncbi:S-methyl-5-thioribose-1-phosphate isomerase [Hungatella hathewayi]|uniref:S-methyl-5-thioribose-1-phosphate isomerase n=1 Tax=Hungatella hathewayi TaxID=154046 RepID=UPI00033F057D|nr:S-methyl-5-thioribose-1-phosphate isomerase [Hungatella hathewayi]CCZ62882.1 methylthioribose-1-phosphate isomerase [Hungatella hathewayi CAG:224]